MEVLIAWFRLRNERKNRRSQNLHYRLNLYQFDSKLKYLSNFGPVCPIELYMNKDNEKERANMGAERRITDRKIVDSIHVAEITSLNSYLLIAREGYIVDASTRGLLMVVTRKDLVPKELRDNLSLDELVGKDLCLYLPQMNIDLDGTVVRANHIGRGVFEIALEFSNEIPEYWRECLVDLLPEPGEIAD